MADTEARVLMDGTLGQTMAVTSDAANAKRTIMLNYIPDTVSAGSHNICVQMRATEGLATLSVGCIRYREIRR